MNETVRSMIAKYPATTVLELSAETRKVLSHILRILDGSKSAAEELFNKCEANSNPQENIKTTIDFLEKDHLLNFFIVRTISRAPIFGSIAIQSSLGALNDLMWSFIYADLRKSGMTHDEYEFLKFNIINTSGTPQGVMITGYEIDPNKPESE